MFAVGPEALVGLGWMQFIHPEDVDRVTDAIEGALRGWAGSRGAAANFGLKP